MPGVYGTLECAKPGCTNTPTRSYRDSNGNTLRLCAAHYYNLVTEGKTSWFGVSP